MPSNATDEEGGKITDTTAGLNANKNDLYPMTWTPLPQEFRKRSREAHGRLSADNIHAPNTNVFYSPTSDRREQRI
jgi:hypothetical protein